MKKAKKILKWVAIPVLIMTAILILIPVSFLTFSPQFGGSVTEEQKLAYEATGHYENGIFLNAEKMDMELDCHSIEQMAREMLQPDPNVSPATNIEVAKVSSEALRQKPDSLVRITWFGHSSFLLEMDGKNILLDPVFGKYAAPHPLLGRERYNKEMPISLDQLPPIDAVIISHDHYDHLDYPTIKELIAKTSHYYVPLGVGNHLRSWGIEEAKIHEMDWWEENALEGIQIALTPSRHMSGRGLSDQSATLWGSWVLKGKYKNLYFSGDGGYGKHFKEIGEKYGPFDLGLMECGQYNKLWADVHMMPEQTVIAGIDVKAEMIVPIHWGAFTLATHSWTDPIERVTKKANEVGMPIATPRIGEQVVVGDSLYPQSFWWEEVK